MRLDVVKADVRFSRAGFNLEARFELGPGWTVLFGPSGAGKTTLLRILSGLQSPDWGAISLGARVLTDTDAGWRLHRASGALALLPSGRHCFRT